MLSIPLKLMAVLVLYRRDLSNSETFATIVGSVQDGWKDAVSILVVDNSPVRGEVVDVPAWLNLDYHHDPTNGGVASAYNLGIKRAQEQGAAWLLLLDQDSQIPPEFISELFRCMRLCQSQDNIAAIVPRIVGESGVLSPKTVRLGYLSNIRKQAKGVLGREVSAINSGAAVRVSFVQLLGGFDSFYWLDYLDHWLFRSIYRRGKEVFLSDSSLSHDLSVESGSMSVSRYANILNAEAHFIEHEGRTGEMFLYTLRLAFRILKHLAIRRNLEFAKADWEMLIRISSPGKRDLRTID